MEEKNTGSSMGDPAPAFRSFDQFWLSDKIPKSIPPVVVINCPGHDDRRAFQVSQHEKLWPFVFMDGVHYGSVEGERIVRYKKGEPGAFWTGFEMGPGEVCCYHSHLKALAFLASTLPTSDSLGLVMEDDANIVDQGRLHEILSNHGELAWMGVDHLQLHNLPVALINKDYLEAGVHDSGTFSGVLRQVVRTSVLAHSYLISRRLASYILENWSESYQIPFDCVAVYLSDKKRDYFKFMNTVGSVALQCPEFPSVNKNVSS